MSDSIPIIHKTRISAEPARPSDFNIAVFFTALTLPLSVVSRFYFLILFFVLTFAKPFQLGKTCGLGAIIKARGRMPHGGR